MGDDKSSVEAQREEEEEEEEMKMALNCPPIYPLPDEIKKMERSETTCRFCGVSYLIFHEFLQLHNRLACLEAELQELRDTAEREKAQREALELGRLERETALPLELQRQAAETARALRGEFEQKNERTRKELEEEYQELREEKERELGVLQAARLRTQREEMEKGSEEREKVLSDALQESNKNFEKQRKYIQQLEERLAVADSCREKAEQLLWKKSQQSETLRSVCVKQQQALQATLSVLRSTGSELTDVRGFLSQLMGAWQAFRPQILQHSTQVFSALREEMKHSNVEFQKMREEREHLARQLMEQRRQSEEQLQRQRNSEEEKLLRLKEELEEKQKRLLSCQQRYDNTQEKLSSWQLQEQQMNRKHHAAEEEVARLGGDLERVRQEAAELRRERQTLMKAHGSTVAKMEEDYNQQLASKLTAALEKERSQTALHLREQMEKSQSLLLQHQRETTNLQHQIGERDQQVRGLQDQLQEERRSSEERRKTQHEERRKMEEKLQKEALQLSQANAELQGEVALLQETVRRECEEREELTAAFSQAQQELAVLRSKPSHQVSSWSPRPPSLPPVRPSASGSKQYHSQSTPLTRSPASPNTLPPFDKGCSTDAGGTRRRSQHRDGSGVREGETRRGGTLPRLNMSRT